MSEGAIEYEIFPVDCWASESTANSVDRQVDNSSDDAIRGMDIDGDKTHQTPEKRLTE